MPEAIAVHPYFKMERQVTATEQVIIFHERTICLYELEIVTGYRVFALHDVYDMSYRRMGEEEGILYLHTKQGVYPYNVKSNPQFFIEAFMQLTKKPYTAE
ncbi:hypothetical protein ABEW34_24925 [Paenibacillus algorifonticola]|uniref:hypothetical protein n=1 Tax=Paenibacillus algorifonticola TaxID=684063 RepID=UPI003D2B2541